MSISHRPSMFFPISDGQDELPACQLDNGNNADAEAWALSPTTERRNTTSAAAVIRLVSGSHPFTFVSQESNFNAFSSPSSYCTAYQSPYRPSYPSYPPYYSVVTRSPTFTREARDLSHGHGQTQYAAVEDVAHRGLSSTRYDAHYQREDREDRYSQLQEMICEERAKQEARETRPRHDLDDDRDDGGNEDDDATVVVEVDDDEEKQIVRGPPLSEVDTRSLTSEQVLFYLGVLKLQEKNLEPAFEYNQEPDGRWSARLTMYRDSLKLPHMRSLAVAKVEICRVALGILKVRHANWRVPDEPTLDLTAQDWRWFSLLQEYVKEMGLSPPESSRYVHRMGFRYEISVGSVSGLGKRKFYTSEDQAIAAAAHQVLYQLITGEIRELSDVSVSQSKNRLTVSPKTPAPRSSMPVASSPTINRAPSAPHSRRQTVTNASRKTESNNGAKMGPIANASNKITKPPAPMSKRARARMRKAAKKKSDYMSNLLPVVNPRISTNAVHQESEPARKWKASPGSLACEIVKLATYREKFDKLCSMLGLKHSFETVPHDPSRINPYPSFTVWATIQDDPFLARVGAIGKVVAFRGTQTEAQEACSKAAVEYVMALVREDHATELNERAQRAEVERFVDKKVSALKANGHWAVDH